MKSGSERPRDSVRKVEGSGYRARSGRGPRPPRRAWVATGAAGFAALMLAGCGGGGSKPTAPSTGGAGLTLVSTHRLSIAEPSDLAINETGTILWTVTNHPEKVYQLDLNGAVVKTLAYVGQDLEGIAYDPKDHTLWAAEENLRQVVHLDLDGNVLAKHDLDLTGEPNNGLEGICVDDSSHLFVLNEKHPGLFIPLKADFSLGEQRTLTFADDYSGMAYHPQKKCFWIVSDQTQRLFLWDRPNVIVEHYGLPFPKPEGVAFDPATNLIYVVSDATNSLYVYRLP